MISNGTLLSIVHLVFFPIFSFFTPITLLPFIFFSFLSSFILPHLILVFLYFLFHSKYLSVHATPNLQFYHQHMRYIRKGAGVPTYSSNPFPFPNTSRTPLALRNRQSNHHEKSERRIVPCIGSYEVERASCAERVAGMLENFQT